MIFVPGIGCPLLSNTEPEMVVWAWVIPPIKNNKRGRNVFIKYEFSLRFFVLR